MKRLALFVLPAVLIVSCVDSPTEPLVVDDVGEQVMGMPTASSVDTVFGPEVFVRNRHEWHFDTHRFHFGYIESWYNTRRRHSALGYESPVNFEKNHARLAGKSGACQAGAGTAGFDEPPELLLPCSSGAAQASDSRGTGEQGEDLSTHLSTISG